jgi:hypothetical protein
MLNRCQGEVRKRSCASDSTPVSARRSSSPVLVWPRWLGPIIDLGASVILSFLRTENENRVFDLRSSAPSAVKTSPFPPRPPARPNVDLAGLYSEREHPPSPLLPPSLGFGGTSWRDMSSLTYKTSRSRDHSDFEVPFAILRADSRLKIPHPNFVSFVCCLMSLRSVRGNPSAIRAPIREIRGQAEGIGIIPP